MPIENLIQSRVDRIFLLDGFLRELHLGRRTKESAVARKVRRNLISEIKEMMAWECDELVDDEDYLDSTTESERAQDESVLPGWCATMDDFSTVFDTVALLDSAPLLTDKGRAFDPSMGRWYAVEEGYPKKTSVSADELGNLAALIKRIEEALDISFTVERFFWTDDQLACGRSLRKSATRSRDDTRHPSGRRLRPSPIFRTRALRSLHCRLAAGSGHGAWRPRE